MGTAVPPLAYRPPLSPSAEALSPMGAELFLPTPDLSGQTATLEQATNALQAQGGLEQHTNRYGADPSQCPFLASMGAAGIELAAQLEASKNDPHRGPTLAELWAAEEAQQATQAVKQATTDEAIALFSAAAPAKPRESEPVAVVSEVSIPTNTQAEQHHLAVLRANQTINQTVQVAPSLPAVAEKPATLPTAPGALQELAPISVSPSLQIVAEAHRQQVTAVPVAEVSGATAAAHPEALVAAANSEQLAQALPLAPIAAQHEGKDHRLSADDFAPGIPADAQSSLPSTDVLPSTVEWYDEAQALPFSPFVAEAPLHATIGLADTTEARAIAYDDGPTFFELAPVQATYSHPSIESLESTLDAWLAQQTESVNANGLQADTPVETSQPSTQTTELPAPAEMIQPAQPEVFAALQAITTLVQELPSTPAGRTEVVPLPVAVQQQLESHCLRLLQAADLPHDQVAVQAAMQQILQAIAHIESQQPLGNPTQQGQLGTHEHKLAIFVSLKQHLIQTAQQHFARLLELSRYLLACARDALLLPSSASA